MKMLTLLACAAVALSALAPAFADEIRTTTTVEPAVSVDSTGVIQTTPIVKRTLITAPVGYRLVPSRMPVLVVPTEALNFGFPANPRDGEEIRVNGVDYEWDSEDQRWERD